MNKFDGIEDVVNKSNLHDGENKVTEYTEFIVKRTEYLKKINEIVTEIEKKSVGSSSEDAK